MLERTQVPLILCWTATIHKVQGLSLDAAVIDLGAHVFEYGMVYVALSHVRSLDGVALLSLSPERVSASPFVSSEMERLRGHGQADSDINHCMSLVTAHKRGYQGKQSVYKHRPLLTSKQKGASSCMINQYTKGSKTSKKQVQCTQRQKNAILEKRKTSEFGISNTAVACAEKNIKQHQHLPNSKQAIHPKGVECPPSSNSMIGQSPITVLDDVMYGGTEHQNPPNLINRALPGEVWQREQICVLSRYSKMSVVDKVSTPDRVRPLQCDEIAPHIRARVQGDGNCLFRAISRHLTGTESNHYAVRRAAIQYLKQNPSLIEYILAGVDAPIEPKRRKAFWNSHVREYLATPSHRHQQLPLSFQF